MIIWKLMRTGNKIVISGRWDVSDCLMMMAQKKANKSKSDRCVVLEEIIKNIEPLPVVFENGKPFSSILWNNLDHLVLRAAYVDQTRDRNPMSFWGSIFDFDGNESIDHFRQLPRYVTYESIENWFRGGRRWWWWEKDHHFLRQYPQ